VQDKNQEGCLQPRSSGYEQEQTSKEGVDTGMATNRKNLIQDSGIPLENGQSGRGKYPVPQNMRHKKKQEGIHALLNP